MDQPVLPGFIARPGECSRYRHTQGGPNTHQGATCLTCQRPLIKVWEIDCRDPRLTAATSGDQTATRQPVFGDLDRLPLYYCWTCCSDLYYRFKGEDVIDVLRSVGGPFQEDFPYPNYPLEYPEQPLSLYGISELSPVVRKWATEDEDREIAKSEIPEAECKELEEFFQISIKTGSFDIWWNQLGGLPYLTGGDEDITCPNCSAQHSEEPLRVIASICNAPPHGLPMIETLEEVLANNGHYNRWVQLTYRICTKCFTVRAANRSD